MRKVHDLQLSSACALLPFAIARTLAQNDVTSIRWQCSYCEYFGFRFSTMKWFEPTRNARVLDGNWKPWFHTSSQRSSSQFHLLSASFEPFLGGLRVTFCSVWGQNWKKRYKNKLFSVTQFSNYPPWIHLTTLEGVQNHCLNVSGSFK